MADRIKARVFLVGCPRSGTTLLQSMLFAHPEIFSFPETHFFKHLFSVDERLTQRRQREGLKRNLAAFVRYPMRMLGIVDRWATAKAWRQARILPNFNLAAANRSISLRYHIETFVKLVDEASVIAGRRIWVEKTPDHLFCIKGIRRHIPDAVFIHILRNGPDTVASLFDAGRKYPDAWGKESPLLIELAVRRWNIAIEESRKYRGDPKHHFVKYETLVAEPAQSLRGICAFLGCDYDANMVDGLSETFGRLVRENEPWKQENIGPVSTTTNAKFKQLFSPDWQEYILCHLDKY